MLIVEFEWTRRKEHGERSFDAFQNADAKLRPCASPLYRTPVRRFPQSLLCRNILKDHSERLRSKDGSAETPSCLKGITPCTAIAVKIPILFRSRVWCKLLGNLQRHRSKLMPNMPVNLILSSGHASHMTGERSCRNITHVC